MNLYGNIRLSNWIGYISALLVAIFFIVFMNKKVNQLKRDESIRISNYAKTIELLNTEINIPPHTQTYLVGTIEQNTSIPVILVDSKGVYIDSKNIDTHIINNPQTLEKELNNMRKQYPPISIILPFGKQYVYYKNSIFLNQLEYFPIVIFLVIGLFIWFSYWYFSTLKKTEQSLLWAGMAKETAHQIGTPLSSIIGWLEILKLENIDKKPIQNIERDVNRLQDITERFSKIGSIPSLENENVVETSKNAFYYLKNRVSKKIIFEFSAPEYPIFIKLNKHLFNWVIENIIKNAVDAMKGEGTIQLKIIDHKNNIYIDISDEGSGITKNNIPKIFKPGFSTKKRGWGLGLSLVRRIIEDYHFGRIFVLNSEINKGTTFRIILKKDL